MVVVILLLCFELVCGVDQKYPGKDHPSKMSHKSVEMTIFDEIAVLSDHEKFILNGCTSLFPARPLLTLTRNISQY